MIEIYEVALMIEIYFPTVLETRNPMPGFWLIWSSVKDLFLARRQLPSCYVLTRPYLCVCAEILGVSPLVSLLNWTSMVLTGPHHMTSFILHHFFTPDAVTLASIRKFCGEVHIRSATVLFLIGFHKLHK